MSLAENLKKLLCEHNTNATRASIEMGLGYTTLRDILNGRSKNPRHDTLLTIARFFNTNVEALVFGHRSETSAQHNLSPLPIHEETDPLLKDEIEVPYLKNVFLSAGNGAYSEAEFQGTPLRFNTRMLREQDIVPAQVSCIKIRGNSMEPMLPDGAIVAIDSGRTNVTDGDMYAIRHDDMLRIKTAYRLPGGGLSLKSFNEIEHPEETYADTNQLDIEVIGRVFWYSVLR